MNDERKTPKRFFDAVNEEFNFTVDAAATAKNTLVARTFWTKEVSALTQSWKDHRVWCNPPYSKGNLLKFVDKAIDEMHVATTCMLIPGDCSTKASQRALECATAILFINKRLAFDDEDNGAKFCNWLALFGGKRRNIASLVLLDLGAVLVCNKPRAIVRAA